MERANPTMTATQLLDLYFLENRARLLEIASFLDRLDRARAEEGSRKDYRHEAFERGLELLLKAGGGRTGAIQSSLSDPTTEPLGSAVGLKATGAWGGGHEGN